MSESTTPTPQTPPESTTPTSPEPADSSRPPSRECDLIMKGGISSGVIYPGAAVELSRSYRFRSLGGASAGAIAAAATAAAEYGRDRGGFERLATLPHELGEHLVDLFQPTPDSAPAFTVLMAALEPGGKRRKLIRLGRGIAGQSPRTVALLGAALLGVPAMLLFGDGLDHPWTWWAWVAVTALAWIPAATLVMLAVTGWLFARRTSACLQDQGFGLTDGHTRDPRVDYPPLTDWMTQTFDDLAGLPVGQGPLTIGHLWGPEAVALDRALRERAAAGGTISAEDRIAAKDARRVDLLATTTCVTLRRPYRFPLTADEFLYCPEHFAALFPEAVIRQLVATSRPAADVTDPDCIRPVTIALRCPDHGCRLRTLPATPDLPVVLVARFSLSFPLLIAAVPLFAIDWARSPGRREVITCWFSDGGISSNFPMHFFDSTLPSRPTFGIDLHPIDPDRPTALVDAPRRGRPPRLPEAMGIRTVGQFARSILATMQDWVDTTAVTVPGYCDRIVTVRQLAGEGGMNLRMPAQTITALSRRGAQAAAGFADFDLDRHRWIRHRVALASTDDMLSWMRVRYRQGGFREFLADYRPTEQDYPFAAADCAQRAGLPRLIDVADGWVDSGHPMQGGQVPQPRADLRLSPTV